VRRPSPRDDRRWRAAGDQDNAEIGAEIRDEAARDSAAKFSAA
jgi:hypothetical protein